MKLPETKKGKIIFCAMILALLITAGVVIVVLLSKEEYRSISVEAVQGSVIVVNEKNSDQAYKGQRLYGGDDVTVKEKSELTMCMNNDKYLYADESTHFRLEDRSTKNASRIRVILDKGSELNELTEKLNADESYEVDTPNSTMSVRGTRFRVTVFTDGEGLVYTLLEVEEGIVFVQLKTVNGRYNGVEKEFYKGQSALIVADAGFSEFVKSEKGEEVWILDYSTLPKEHLPRLKALLEMLKNYKEEPDGGKPAEEPAKPTEEPEDIKPTEEPKVTTEPEVTAEPEITTEPEVTTTPTVKPTQAEPTITEEPTCETLGHSFSAWTTVEAATCLKAGTETRKCTRCGETESRTVAKKSHNWGEWKTVKEPTCVSSGLEERRCTACAEAETKTVPATGDHSYSSWTTVKAATCNENGTESRKCTVCGKTETRTVNATGNHSWNDFVEDTPARCGQAGEGHYVCSVCGAEGEHETIPKLTHNYQVYSQENIDSEHYKVTYKCEYCGSEYSATKAGQIQ